MQWKCVVLTAMALPLAAWGWGNSGHRTINRLAVESLPKDAPAFLRTPEAAAQIEYLGPEPDRWRNQAEPELVAAQAPEHFIDLELADALGRLPHRRLDFEAMAFAAGQRPEKIGLQPWQTVEVWERLKSAFREWRQAKPGSPDQKGAEQAVLFYAGWLGHYVGDGAQPLHTSVNYNGWVGANPNGYTTAHKIHWQFEGPFVDANIPPADVRAHMKPPSRIQGDIFDAYLSYLRETATYVEKVYELEKAGGWEGKGSPQSRDFAATRVAAGAAELRDLIEEAWLRSGDPESR